jgi:hypothetical protein
MLDAKINRLDYGEQLIPLDSSYELDFAVGTTYSLDLEAILVLPVAMFYSRPLDCSPDALHFDVLDAITQSASKIRVYCQKGKIKVPKRYNRLMTYWEKGISQISMDSAFSSFHPKVWVVRFTKAGCAPFYRLLITSRNLTYAHDWDMAFASEGLVGTEANEKNQPLIQFLQYLTQKDGKPYPGGFLEDLGKVAFESPEGLRLMNFHPIGIRPSEGDDPLANPLGKKTWDDLLVVSPFVDTTTLGDLKKKVAGKMNLFSRKDELDKIDPDLLTGIGTDRVYQFSEFISKGEGQEGICDGNPLEPMPQNLHAKLFIGSKNGYTHWFMGSANCTLPAFDARNVEFMVELKTDQSKLTPSRIAKSLAESPKGEPLLFELYQGKGPEAGQGDASIEGKLRKVIFDLTTLVFVGEISLRDAIEHELFDLVIQCDARALALPDHFSVQVKPLPDATSLARDLLAGQINQIADFKGYNELQLSPYLEIDVCYEGNAIKSFVAEMTIDLPGTRMDRIFRSIIDDKEKFFKYLAFLLGGSTPDPMLGDSQEPEAEEHDSGKVPNSFAASLYEEFLVAASRRPDRLRSAKRVIGRLKDEHTANSSILTEDFLKLWSVFDAYLEPGKK